MNDQHGQFAGGFGTYTVTTPHGTFKRTLKIEPVAISVYRVTRTVGYGRGPSGRVDPGDKIAVFHRKPLEKMKYGPVPQLGCWANYLATYDMHGRELSITRSVNTVIAVAPK